MKYPAEFVADVKAEYPEWKEVHRALEMGSEFVGRYLDDSREYLGTKDILEATSLEQLQAKARKIELRDALYRRWCVLYYAHKAQEGER